MSTCYINVTPEQVKNVASVIPQEFPDSVIVLAPVIPVATYSPTKKKDFFRIKFEAIIPSEAVLGPSALTDFGGYMLLRLPKNRLQPHFLADNEERKSPENTEVPNERS